MECPPGDRLIGVVEAAQMLDVSPNTVYAMVARGRLFARQKQPGRHGSRLFLSRNQVDRLLGDAGYRARHDANKNSRGRNSHGSEELNLPEWVIDSGLRDEDRAPRRPNIDRDWGEFFTARQAARVLGIDRRIVGVLRQRGRLQGHRSPRANPNSRGAWWFFRKEDVYALAQDRSYTSRRDRMKKALGADPKPLTEEELYEFIKINAFGRPPRGQIIETGWSWGDTRLYHTSPFVVDPGDPPGGWWDAETWREMLK
jgi:hypothetical protein